jgi:hypothetical protein
MFSRKKTAITARSRLDIWITGTKIKQFRKHKILGLIFDTRMNWNEHILSIKTKAEKINIIKCLAQTKWVANQIRSICTTTSSPKTFICTSNGIPRKATDQHQKDITLATVF